MADVGHECGLFGRCRQGRDLEKAFQASGCRRRQGAVLCITAVLRRRSGNRAGLRRVGRRRELGTNVRHFADVHEDH